MIDTILKFQGFSQIVEWKKELKSIDSLEGPFKNKLKEDLNIWKQGILTPKVREAPKPKPVKIEIPSIKKEIAEVKQITQIDTSVNLDNLQHVNHSPLESQPSVSETPQEVGSIRSEFNNLIPKLDVLSCKEISKELLNITDIILETRGYSMTLKEMKQMNDKIRSIRGILDPDTKNDLINKINSWKEKLGSPPISKEITEVKQITQIDTSVNLDNLQHVNHSPLESQPSVSETPQEVGSIRQLFNNIIQQLNNLSGVEISKKLLNVTDIILETRGYSMTLKEMKQWNDKIRPIKDFLDTETKNNLINVINSWKEKFG